MANNLRWELSLDGAKAKLRQFDLRCTAARIAVIQCLNEQSSPMTPVDITEQLREYGFDKSTIYRSLTELTDAGMLVRLDLGDAVRRFELPGEEIGQASHHPHFMCVDCGAVVCLSDFTIELKSVKKKSRAPGVISEVLVRGHCEACLS